MIEKNNDFIKKHNAVNGAVLVLAVLSVIIALVSAAAGIISPETIYNADSMVEKASNDIVTVAILLPAVAVGLILALFRKPLGGFLLAGGLYALSYGYIPYIFDSGLGIMLLGYLTITASSLCALAVLFASFAGKDGGMFSFTKVKNTITGILLIVLAVFVVFFQASDILSYEDISLVFPGQAALYFADIVLAVPLLLSSGVMILQRKRFGYLIGFSVILGYLIQCVSLIPFFFIFSRNAGTALDVEGIFAISIMIVICIVPVIFFAGQIKNKKGA